MAKLVLNDDGSVTLPLVPNDEKRTPREIVLPEPSMAQLAELHQIASAADEALPDFDQLPEDPTPEDAERFTGQLRARTVAMFGSTDSPHGQAIIAFVKVLTGESVGPDDLYGWAMGPRTAQRILNHFQAPLHGEGAVPGAPT